jgi:hypothetical protein
MHAPQIIWIVLTAMNAVIYLMKDGELVELSFWKYMISVVLSIALLWWGGFWN